MKYSKNKISDEDLIKIAKSSKSMAEAAAKSKLHFNTFKRRAVKLGVYNPNQAGKGISKPNPKKIPTKDILEGKHPQYQTYKLGRRLIEENVIEYKCSQCQIKEWQGQKISLELDHIDGDRNNHLLENLRWLCPNCHSQTSTFRGKNIKTKNVI